MNLPPVVTTVNLIMPPGIPIPGDESVWMARGFREGVGDRCEADVDAGSRVGGLFDLEVIQPARRFTIPNCRAVGFWQRLRLWVLRMFRPRTTIRVRFRIERTSKEEKRLRMWRRVA